MSRFKVGDIIRQEYGRKLYEVTASYEGFCQAKMFHRTIHADIIMRQFMIDDLDKSYVLVEVPKNKYDLKQHVMFIDMEKKDGHYEDYQPGIVTGYIAELVNSPVGLLTKYYYYILPDNPVREGRASLTRESLIKIITNTNSLWNELNEV